MTPNAKAAPEVTAALSLVHAWAVTLRDDGKATRTIESYTTDVKRFVDYDCGERGWRRVGSPEPSTRWSTASCSARRTTGFGTSLAIHTHLYQGRRGIYTLFSTDILVLSTK